MNRHTFSRSRFFAAACVVLVTATVGHAVVNRRGPLYSYQNDNNTGVIAAATPG